jgi:hypothetical protein
MVVDNLDLFGPFIRPSEYDPPLIVYADRMPSRQVAAQGFQAISRRRCKITQDGRVVELPTSTAISNICRNPPGTRHCRISSAGAELLIIIGYVS